jgi:hypothetical protein
MVDKGMMKSLEVSRAVTNSSQSVCFGLICMRVLLDCISWESTQIIGNSKKLQQSIDVKRWII